MTDLSELLLQLLHREQRRPIPFKKLNVEVDRMQELERAVIAEVDAHRYQRLEDAALTARLAIDPLLANLVLRRLQDDGRLVVFAPDRYLTAGSLAALETTLAAALREREALSTGEIKRLPDAPRNALIDLLEWLDRRGLTVREGGCRRLAG